MATDFLTGDFHLPPKPPLGRTFSQPADLIHRKAAGQAIRPLAIEIAELIDAPGYLADFRRQAVRLFVDCAILAGIDPEFAVELVLHRCPQVKAVVDLVRSDFASREVSQ